MSPIASRSRRVDVLIAGGGTAGHVLPAIAVAGALVDAGYSKETIRFVGARRGMEAEMVPKAGYSVILLPGRGIVRRLAWANVRAIASLVSAAVLSFALVAMRRPKVIVVLGGYASVGPAVAGFFCRVPIVVVNLDADPGAANRLIGRFAKCCTVAYDTTALPRSVMTGLPVRAAVLEIDLSNAARNRRRERLGVTETGHLVVITGGSLGAGRLNDLALGLAERFFDRNDLLLYHVTGERNLAQVEQQWASHAGAASIEYRRIGFDDQLAEVIASCDVVIGRAGASTVAELCVLGAASILVPLPNSPGDHQRHNAEMLQRVGAAIVIDDASATADHVGPLLENLMADAARRSRMGDAAKSIGVRDGAARIARVVDEVALGEVVQLDGEATGARRQNHTAKMGS